MNNLQKRISLDISHRVTSGVTHANQNYRNLWAAVISQTLKDAAATDMYGERKLNRRTALHFIYSNDPSPRSFLWICELLNIDVEAIRIRCVTRASRRHIIKSLTK